MCSHYQAVKERERYLKQYAVLPPAGADKFDIWPCYTSTFIRGSRQALSGLFGLIPHWASDATFGRRTYNARSETVAVKPSFRDAWKNGQHCIIPAEAFFEPDWRSGKAVPTRIALADGQPMGIAGLWSAWQSPQGLVHSFTMLTINADQHPLMRQFHKPADEKRMVVILPPDRYDAWLQASPAQSMAFMRPYPADQMLAEGNIPSQPSLLP
jgi:putative SOS response-associated peptidase YedK